VRAVAALVALMLLALALLSTAQSSERLGDRSAGSSPAEAYGRLPLSFVPNRGQTDRQVRFHAQAPGFGAYLTRRSVVLALSKGTRGEALQLWFVGANSKATLAAGRRAPGRVNYLTGSRNYTNLPAYRQVAYKELWPGVDLALRGANGRLKYEFVVHPGAAPESIALAYRGAEGLALSPAGDLLVRTPLGVLRDEAPTSYQVVDGRTRPVASRFAVSGAAYGFDVGRYDGTRPLVIDPGIVYSTLLGGSSLSTFTYGVAVDRVGHAYVTGQTCSDDFPTTPGAYDTTGTGCNAFVSKLKRDGSGLVYSTFIGADTEGEGAAGIAVDGHGDAYITGYVSGPDFPTTPGAYQRDWKGSLEWFAAKLNASGSGLVYSTYIGGSQYEAASAIAVDRAGEAILTGYTASLDFPTTPGAFDSTPDGQADIPVVKLNADGTGLVYSTLLGPRSYGAWGTGVAADDQGGATVTGWIGAAAALSPTPGAYDTTYNGQTDAFVSKLTPDGAGQVYATYLGTSGDDYGRGVALDREGNVYLAGQTHAPASIYGNPDFPTTPGAFDTTSGGPAFVAKLDQSASQLDYSTFIANASAASIAVDRFGSAYVTGFANQGFPTTPGAYDTTPDGNEDLVSLDAYLTKLSPDGSALLYSTLYGGENRDEGFAIAVDVRGDAYVSGLTDGDFPTTPGAFQRTGSYSGFIGKFDLRTGRPPTHLSPKPATRPVPVRGG
jgi:hypothetical protein